MEKELLKELEEKLRKMLEKAIDDLIPNPYNFSEKVQNIKCLSKSLYIVEKLKVADIVEKNNLFIDKIAETVINMDFSPEQILLSLEPLMQLREVPYFPYQPKDN